LPQSPLIGWSSRILPRDWPAAGGGEAVPNERPSWTATTYFFSRFPSATDEERFYQNSLPQSPLIGWSSRILPRDWPVVAKLSPMSALLGPRVWRLDGARITRDVSLETRPVSRPNVWYRTRSEGFHLGPGLGLKNSVSIVVSVSKVWSSSTPLWIRQRTDISGGTRGPLGAARRDLLPPPAIVLLGLGGVARRDPVAGVTGRRVRQRLYRPRLAVVCTTTHVVPTLMGTGCKKTPVKLNYFSTKNS